MMKYLQRLGKSLMLPVACLPVAAILQGIGYWIDPTGWGANNVIAAFLLIKRRRMSDRSDANPFCYRCCCWYV